VGVGLAFATLLKQESNVTIIFLGDGATEEGVFTESLNFAALKNLPVLFICENNFYSVYSPLDVRQPPQRDRVALAEAHGLPAKKGDGNHVEEVFHMAAEAFSSIRHGNGPVYLEFDTYRYREHCGPFFDNDIGYRSQEEVAIWESRCPLKQMKLSADEIETLRQPIMAEIKEAFEFAENSPFPDINMEPETPYA
jgi:pyruvate dehydrogenase E1 component alpha subunit